MATAKRKPTVRTLSKTVTTLKRKLKTASTKLKKVRKVAKRPRKRVVKKAAPKKAAPKKKTNIGAYTFRNIKIYATMPKGYKRDNNTGSPLFGHVYITDGKSVLNGGKRALLRVVTLSRFKDSKDFSKVSQKQLSLF